MNNLKDRTVGIIGAGNMGSALISGASKELKPGNILCFDIDTEKLNRVKDNYKVNPADNIEHLSRESDIIILAIKPDIIPSVLESIKNFISGKLLVSIAAGFAIKTIRDIVGRDKSIIRVMPNTPSLIGNGMAVISADKNVDSKDIELVEGIFSLLGRVMVLPEKLMDAVTAVSGCGPAYGFMLIQAMADGGVKMGIPRDKAVILAAQTVSGAASLVLESGEEPLILRGKVTSPGGSTIDAVHILEKAGFSGIVMDAIETAAIKSERLGGKGK